MDFISKASTLTPSSASLLLNSSLSPAPLDRAHPGFPNPLHCLHCGLRLFGSYFVAALLRVKQCPASNCFQCLTTLQVKHSFKPLAVEDVLLTRMLVIFHSLLSRRCLSVRVFFFFFVQFLFTEHSFVIFEYVEHHCVGFKQALHVYFLLLKTSLERTQN